MVNRICLAALAVVLVLGGCQDEATPEPSVPPTTATTTTSPSPTTPSPTPTFSPEEAAAMQAVVDFWEKRNELGLNPELGVTSLAEVARGQAFDLHSRILNSEAQEGLRQQGSGVVTPTSVEPGEGDDQFVVTACLDVSGVDVVDADGNSVVPPDRPPQAAYDYVVERDGEQWFVVEDLLEAKDC